MKNSDLLIVEKLVVSSPKEVLVGPVNLSLKAGSFTALIGASAAGKSLLAKSLIGLNTFSGLQESVGSYIWKGNPYESSDIGKLRGRSIFYLFQDSLLSFSPSKTIGKHLDDFIAVNEIDVSHKEIDSWFEKVGLDHTIDWLARYPFEVSGGQLQRIAFVFALISPAELIIIDEPTTSLDILLKIEVLALIKEVFSAQGKAVLLISHQLKLIQAFAEDYIFLDHGQIIIHGDLTVLKNSSDPNVQAFIQATEPKNSIGKSRLDDKQLIEVKGLQVKYKQGDNWIKKAYTVAVDQVDIRIPEQGIIGLIGVSGSGKSSIALSLAGLKTYNSNTIHLNGQSATEESIAQAGRLILQHPASSLNPKLRVREHLEEACKIGSVDPSQIGDFIQELLLWVDLTPSILDQYTTELSGGQAQRLAIIRALATQPKYLICDECLSSLDPVSKQIMITLFKRINQERGISILLISHDITVVQQLSDQYIFIDKGRIVSYGFTDDINRSDHPKLKAIIAAGQ